MRKPLFPSAFLTIGIATVARKSSSYLPETLRSLVEQLHGNDKKDVHIVVFLADLTKKARISQWKTLEATVHWYVAQDILHVIEAPSEFYPPLDNLKKKYNDSAERIKWRSKQNIDYAFLMCYCRGLSNYYLHLEDDVKVAPSFFPKLRDFIDSQAQPWKSLDASRLGHIGKVYHSKDLGSVASLFYAMYDEMPCDWLMMYWRAISGDQGGFLHHTGSLFEHRGIQSSLRHKINNRTEAYFDQYDHKYLGLNPAAVVTTSLTPHKGEPQDPYVKGIGYYWAKWAKKGDSFQILYKSPVHVKEVSIQTGSNLAPNDRLQSAYLQINHDVGNCSNFLNVGEFVGGKIHVHLEKTVTCLQVMVSESQGPWVFLREINVWT